MQERTADGYVFRTDLRLRPDPGLDPDRGLAALGAELLREHRAELGARRDDQGAPLRRRSRARRDVPARGRALHLAQISRLRRGRRRARDEAPDGGLQGPRRDRDRGPQHQARARRHPRDRVLRADPAADRGRPASRSCAAARRWQRWPTSPRAAGSPARRRATWPRPIASCAWSSTGCRWWPTSRPIRCRRSARGSSASRAFSGLPDATPSRPRCSSTCARCSATTRGCSRMRPPPKPRAARSRFPPDKDDTDNARQARRDGLPPPARGQPGGAPLARGRIPLAQERVRARASRRAGAGADRPSGARGKSRPGARRARPLPRRAAWRRAAPVAAAAQSRSRRAARARARHRAAARRHPGDPSRR